jgi:hypothetical protein
MQLNTVEPSLAGTIRGRSKNSRELLWQVLNMWEMRIRHSFSIPIVQSFQLPIV